MRHRSIETTLRYYVEQDADELAAELWAADSGRPIGTFVGTSNSEAADNDSLAHQERTEALGDQGL
jgi:hypothetical protein